MPTHPEIVVRPATPEDAEDLGRIHVASWRAAYAGVMPGSFLDGLDPDARTARWRTSLTEDGSPASLGIEGVTLVAELDGRVAAMTSLGDARGDDVDAPTGELWMLNTDPAAFGTGVATALHTAAISWLRERHDRAFLWVVDPNPRARRFYEREGWSADGVTKVEEIGGAPITEIRLVHDLAG